ncbi:MULTISPECIES: MlaC/ttg2D family ABC transporter substrate-binding protein [unclassified Campylobacter]|uniref:MlaC/ttg2D family ABC transporter substrate-binding protein n=1 Tax=unclassified Campylobacter TaxID=2593542 RepID=UPI001D340CB0|nr:ABC transporter substrate-binding protein [Campylobacter sp. RM9331]MBZ7993070.1 ABC transporter substrate-binding protein [Campylobacter sp. RM9333]MBZ8005891.1 ABC transporter substrate-binding protein [Campylobacter sp. RM9332]MBZ8007828.1 ABC transporter substrate-binding protein [Campylobacter sp. RM9334]
MKKLLIIALSLASLYAYKIDTFKDDIVLDVAKIQDIFKGDGNDKSQDLFNLLKDDLDIELMTKLVLSKNANELSAEKLAEFQNIFIERLKKDFSSKIDLVKGSSLELTSTNIDDKRCQANMKVEYEEQVKEMIFKFRIINNECKLYDIDILNTSLIASYRAQFLDIIKQSGINGLFEKLK